MFSPHNSRPLRRKVYIGDLGNNGSVEEIGNAFSLFGPLRNVWVARNPPGFAFVDFEDPSHAEEAIRALNGTILCGRRVRVNFARNSRSSYRSPALPPPLVQRNDSYVICYICGEVGHYARDCLVRQIDYLNLVDDLDASYESDEGECCSSDCDCDWDLETEWMTNQPRNYYYPIYPHDGGNSSNYQRRNNRPQEEHQNAAWGPIRYNGPQDEPSNRTWRSRRSNRSRENSRDVASRPHRNNRSEGDHRNARSQGQRSSSNTQCSPETASAIPTSSTSTPIDTSSDIKCAICLDTVEDRMEYIPCGHGFHAKCCNDWLSVNGVCPVCRTRVASRNGNVQDDEYREMMMFIMMM